ncbi:AMP-binding protein [Pseudoteredinibacter isoporae]|uniref:AMP-binding protein n=1 Tax=Pseudoteredinibacter isoporae TaxID=570281 RepID=UPI00310236D1
MKAAAELNGLLNTPRAGDELVAYRGSEHLYWGDFTSACNGYIQRFSQYPKGSWALYDDDAFRFVCQLMALWQLGNTVYLPGDNLPANCQRLNDKVLGFIGDFPRLSSPFCEAPEPQVSRPVEPIDNDAISMVIFTSGSSGEPSEVPVSLRQLNAEAATLELQFGQQLNNCAIASTVSHQHLYGFTFALLWPLLYRRPFPCQRTHYIEELPSIYRHHPETILISTPSHLSRLPPNIEEQSVRDSTQLVFSSTAPLAKPDSDTTRQYFQSDVIEIYGSSETGAIAWRNQAQQPYWTTLPNIQIKDDKQRLNIKSPHCFDTDWQRGNDKIQRIDDGRFELIGRIDRIAKVEGVRVSLTAMEARIERQADIRRARVLGINETGGLGAVVELNASSLPDTHTRKTLTQRLKHALLEEFALPTVPKKWRFVERLPEDSQGKVRMSALLQLFHRKDPNP